MLDIGNKILTFIFCKFCCWKDKDCAIYLVVSLATKKAGGSLVSTDLVDVQSFFAASCIEKLLLVKDEGGRSTYTANDVAPFFVELMTNLFNAFKFPESEENQYISCGLLA